MVCTHHSQIFPFYPHYADIESLEISGNFTQLEMDSRYQNLHHLKVQSINFKDFSSQNLVLPHNVEILDLSQNCIESVTFPPTNHKLFTQLSKIDLSNNMIESFSVSNIPPSLKEVALKGNKVANVLYNSKDRHTDFQFRPNNEEFVIDNDFEHRKQCEALQQ